LCLGRSHSYGIYQVTDIMGYTSSFYFSGSRCHLYIHAKLNIFAYRFLNCVVVRDLRTMASWRFIYNGWLQLPAGAEAGTIARAR